MTKTTYRPPFQIDWPTLQALTIGSAASSVDRELSAQTLHMCLAAMDAMRFNRYWKAGGGFLSEAQIVAKNKAVDQAIFELLEELYVRADYAAAGDTGSLAGSNGDCEEEMADLAIVRIGGRAYLADLKCACGDTPLYDLTASKAVSVLNQKTGEVTVGVQKALTSTGDTFSLDDSFLSCYALKAATLLLQIAYTYSGIARNIATQAAAVLVGDLGDLFNFDEIGLELLDLDASTGVDLILGNTDEGLAAAYSDAEYIQIMADHWTYTGPVSLGELREWAAKSPVKWDGIAVRSVLIEAVTYASILGVNDYLNLYAQECRTGNDYDDVADYVESIEAYGEYVGQTTGLTYPVWVRSPEVVIGVNEQYVSPDKPTGSVLAIAVDITVGAPGNAGIAFNGHTGAGWTGVPGGSSRQYWAIWDSTNWEEVAAIIEQFISGLDGGGASVGSDANNKFFWQSSGSCTLHTMVVVGNPL